MITDDTRKTILVADDCSANLRLMKILFAKHGYDVVTADDGEHAIAVSEIVKVDLFLMDMDMPRKNGIETAEQLRGDSNYSETPVVFYSATDARACRDDVERVRGNDFLQKPIPNKELIRRVAAQLN